MREINCEYTHPHAAGQRALRQGRVISSHSMAAGIGWSSNADARSHSLFGDAGHSDGLG